MNGRSATVLVVDDEAAVLEVVRETLTRAGFLVHSAACVADALDRLGSIASVDLLLTDIRMPKIDGIRLADMVRFLHPETHILFMTAYDLPTGPGPSLWHGRTLPKPFRSEELLRAVKASMEAESGPIMHYADGAAAYRDTCGRSTEVHRAPQAVA